MYFQTIASGSTGNCYLVSDGDSQLMIECGVIKKVLMQRGVVVSDLDGCLITHSHSDHSKGVDYLLKSGVDCYMSQGTASELDCSGHRVHIVKSLKPFEVAGWKVLPFDTMHDTKEPLGFLVQSPSGSKLLFATDTGCVKYRFEGLNTIAIECNYDADIVSQAVEEGGTSPFVAKRLYSSHMGLQTAKRMLLANDLSAVREIHLLHLSDGHSDAARFKKEIAAITGKPVYIADSL